MDCCYNQKCVHVCGMAHKNVRKYGLLRLKFGVWYLRGYPEICVKDDQIYEIQLFLKP